MVLFCPTSSITSFSIGTIFEWTAATILGAIGSLESACITLSGVLVDLIALGFTVQIMWHGYNIHRGQVGNNYVLDVFAKYMRPMLVIGFCFSVNNLGGTTDPATCAAYYGNSYNDTIVPFFIGSLDPTNLDPGESASLQGAIVSAFNVKTSPPTSSGSCAVAMSSNPFAGIDQALVCGKDAYLQIEQYAFSNFVPKLTFLNVVWALGNAIVATLAGGIMLIIILVLCIVTFADLIVNYIGLKIIFGVGPIFLACYAFEATASYCNTWLSAVLKWIFTNIVLLIIINLAVSLLASTASNVGNLANAALSSGSDDDYQAMIESVIACICAMTALIIFSGKANGLAGDLVGGASISTFAGRVSQAVGGVAQKPLSFVGKGVASAGKKAAGAISSRRGGGGGDGNRWLSRRKNPGARYMGDE